MNLNGGTAQAYSVQAYSGGTVNLAGADLSANNLYLSSNGSTITQTAGAVDVSGQVRLDNGTSTYSLSDGSLSAGSLQVNTGTFNLSGGSLTAGSLNLLAAGTFELLGGEMTATSMTLYGTFDFQGGRLNATNVEGNLTNTGGTFSPGASPGAATIVGDLVQQAGATLLMEFDGPNPGEYDTINVIGDAQLAGTLLLDFTGFTPTGPFGVDLVTATSLTESFGDVQTPGLSPAWQATIDSSTGTVLSMNVVYGPPAEWQPEADGNWDDAGNWNYLPDALSVALIQPSAGLRVTGPASTTTVRLLVIGARNYGVAELALGSDMAGQESVTIEDPGRWASPGQSLRR